MLLKKEKLQFINSIAHEGKILVFGTDADGKISYTVKQDGYEDSANKTDLKGWENWQELSFPSEAEDPSVVAKERAELTYGAGEFLLRSRYNTQAESAAAPSQLVSGLGHLYVFRQSKSNTLLVDRFVLDGMANKLVRKLDIRFKRSRQKYQPLQQANKNRLSIPDSLDFRDANGNFFYEPTTELCLVNNLHRGWFSIVLLPTDEQDKYRWHIFAYNNQSGKVELTSIRASAEGLFEVKDQTRLEESLKSESGIAARSIPGIIKRTIEIKSQIKVNGQVETKAVKATNGLAAIRYDTQVERQTEAGPQLLKLFTRVMLAIPTDRGSAAAISFGVGNDGTLAQIDEVPQSITLRADQRHVLLPLNTLDEIKAFGASAPPPQGLVTAVARGADDMVEVTSEQAAALSNGDLVKLEGTASYDGHYVANKVNNSIFEINRNWAGDGMGRWEVVPKEETGLIFDGIITAFTKTDNGGLRVFCPNHGLESGDEAQITGTRDYNSSYLVTKLDEGRFAIDVKWQPGEAVNLKLASRKRRGVMFDGINDYIATPSLDLKAPSANAGFGATFSAWVNSPSRTSGLIIGQQNGFMRLALDQGAVVFEVNLLGGPVKLTAIRLAPAKQWVHVAGVIAFDHQKKETTLAICQDGVEVARQTFHDAPQTSGWSGVFFIGGAPAATPPQAFFAGKIADAQVWRKARPAQEIKDSMCLQLTGRESSLAGYWRLGAISEGKERKVADFSVHGNDAIVHGGAFVSARTLDRTLRDGTTTAVKYVNDELFAVPQRAAYVESFEFKVEPAINPNDADGRGSRIFEFAYWGKKSRGSDERISFIGEANDFEDLGGGWQRASCRFTAPDEITLARSFGIEKVKGNWKAMEIRNHTIRLVADAITEARYDDQVSLPLLDDTHAEMEEKLKKLTQKEKEELLLLAEKRELEEKLAQVDDRQRTQEKIDRLTRQIKNLEDAVGTLNSTYEKEVDNPLNYWCRIRVGTYWQDVDRAARIFTDGKNFIYSDFFKANNTNQRFKFVLHQPDDSYAIICDYENRILDLSLGRGIIFGNTEHHLNDNQRWKINPLSSAGLRGALSIRSMHKLYAMDLKGGKGHTIYGCEEYHGKVNQQWLIERTGGQANDNIPIAYSEWQAKKSELSRKKKERDDLMAVLADGDNQKAGWLARLEKVNKKIEKLLEEIASLNTGFIEAIPKTQIPQAMPELKTDGRGLTTQGALLGFVRPIGRLTALESCEGKVQLSYFASEGRMRLTNFDVASDSRNNTFEQWIPDALRVGLNFDKNSSVVRLNAPIPLDDEWTIEAWFSYPFSIPGSQTLKSHALLGCDNHDCPIYVEGGKHLGAQIRRSCDSGFDLTQLSPGWHHLAAVGKQQTTLFYIDGKLVADLQVNAIAAAEARVKQFKDSNQDTKSAEAEAEVEEAKSTSYKSTGQINVVGNSPDGDAPFGKLAEVRIWQVALNAEEIESNSKMLLSGNEPGLVAYYPMNDATGAEAHDHSGNGRDGAIEGASWWGCAAPIGHLEYESADAAVSDEYVTFGLDPETGYRSALMRRFMACPAPGGVMLLADKRIESLDREWIGNAQFEPTLLGYIEGPPPVPSENLTEGADYTGATSVELAISEDMTFSWNRAQETGMGANLSLFVGVDSRTYQLTPTGQSTSIEESHAGFKGDVSFDYSWINQSSVAASASSRMSDKLELRGSPERQAKFERLGPRFIPKNVGYALVISGLADVYIVRLKRSRKMVSYRVELNQDVPRDINTITFLMNPAYTMNGSLDGLTGSSATSDRFFRHVPEMRAQYGALYPASYYRIQEAYELKRQIEAQDKEREAYFHNFDSLLVDEPSLGRAAKQNSGQKRLSDDEKKQREKEIKARGEGLEQQTHSLDSFVAWQKKMENLLIRAGKRNIVNTYVWDADGGLRTESQGFANTVEHTIGGSFHMQGALGAEIDFAVLKASFSLTAQATFHLTQTMTKTASRGVGFGLEVDLSGMEGIKVTDHNDLPILAGEKVDRYRFMSFYLEADTNHFNDFFGQVVDPEWLQSNSEEARALRQTMGKPNKAWRVLHRVTYVERPALMGVGSLRKQPTAAEISLGTLRQAVASLSLENKEMKQKLDQIIRMIDLKRK